VPEDIVRYEETLNYKLNLIDIPFDAINCQDYSCTNHFEQIEKFHDEIISACISASEETIPVNRVNGVQGRAPGRAGWNDEVKEWKRRAIFWHDLWKENGRPHHGVVADIRRHTRAQYHLAVKRNKKNQDKVAANKLAESIGNNNNTDFWKDIKKMKGTGTVLPNSMDNVKGMDQIVWIM
jgi:hypothetical protein